MNRWMHDASDMDLLRQYAAGNSDAAFAALVSRHVDLVYSAALRKTSNPHAAEEITQAVFIVLAQKAGRIPAKTILPGWLYQTARLTASSFLRGEIRRVHREQEAYMQTEPHTVPPDQTWDQLAPLLEDAMGQLGDKDRAAVVLRFFGGKSFAEVAAAAGVSENAAKKRVGHALEKLHRYFAQRGVSSTTAIIAGAISTHSVQTAPLALAKTVAAVAAAKGATASASTLTLIKGALKIMAWTKAKTASVGIVAVLLAAGTTLTVREVAHYREDSIWSKITGRNLGQELRIAPPTVSIRPTGFTREFARSAEADGKILGTFRPFDSLLAFAYDTSRCRIYALSPLPQGEFDFIASLPRNQKDGLQKMIRQKFRLAGRLEKRDTDVLRLTVKRRSAPGLKPSLSQEDNSTSTADVGHYKRINGLIDFLCYDLEDYLQIPIVDQTGLEGRFDMELKWHAEVKWDDAGHYYFTNPEGLKQAILDQLGLELVPANLPVEMLVVEKAK